MRIAIYGSGGLGGYYGARLVEAGHDVHFIARGAHLDAMRRDGLRVLSPLGDAHINSPQATPDPNEVGEVDLVIVAVKTWQVPEVAKAMQPMVGAHTRMVPFLNGVDSPGQLAQVHGSQRVMGGLSRIFSFIESPGVIRHLNPSAYVQIGDIDGGVSESTENVRAMFEHAGVDAEVSDDIGSELWKKLLLVTSWAGISTLTGFALGVLREQPETRALIDASMDEGIAVGRALGHSIPENHKDTMWAFYDGLPPDVTASMMRDIRAGKPSELHAWNGAIVRYGEQTGVPTPVQHMVYQMLIPAERIARDA